MKFMFLDRRVAIFLAIILFLIIGLAIGYSIGVTKSPKLQNVVYNNPIVGNGSNIKSVNTNITAKEAYAVALKESQSWPEDTYLSGIELVSKNFNEKGLSSGWKVVLYSKLKNKSYEIMVKDGESRGVIEKSALPPVQTLKGEMIDSSVLAKAFFDVYSLNTEIISLKMYYDKSNKKFIWTIFFPKGSYTTDAEI